MNDIDVLAREQVVVILVAVHAKRFRERIELRAVGPRRGHQFGARVFRQRPRKVVSRIPMAKAQDGDSILTIHEISSQLPAPSFQPLNFRPLALSSIAGACWQRGLELEAGSWKLVAFLCDNPSLFRGPMTRIN